MSPTGIPPVGALPAEIRAAGPEAQETYRAALGFERVLLGQLTQALRATGDEETQQGPYAQMLPGAMADALTAGGGIGLADELYRALRVEDGR